MQRPIAAAFVLTLLAATTPCAAQPVGNAIFIHPDGASAASWAAARALWVGPDADLEWDKLPHIAVYRGHMSDSLTASSNGGATAHATGARPGYYAFGRFDQGEDAPRILDDQGRYRSVAVEALNAGLRVGVVQSGTAIEPGTAIFLTDAARRKDYDQIAEGILKSGAHVILGGGERHFLPGGAQGVYGPGTRKDGRNLVDEARQLGYTVIYTREELLALPDNTPKVLGLFAEYHTFHDLTEEQLTAKGLPMYEPDAPTLAEMTDVALRLLSNDDRRFLLVVEEEGPDNFGNHNNASGMLEALRRSDEALGVSRRFVADNPDTLLITCADSDAGGARLMGIRVGTDGKIPEHLPERDRSGSMMDGVEGTGGQPFLAKPDRSGRRLPFKIVWAATDDVSGGVLVRAEGLNAERVRGNMDNIEVPELIRRTLFGDESNLNAHSD
jgi:alkaline phosphatase